MSRPGLGTLGAGLLIVVTATTIMAPVLAKQDPAKQDLASIFAPPSAEHWLGADQLGRDVFSRLLHGGALSLGLTAIAVVIAVAVGVVLAVIATSPWRGADSVLSRLADIQLAVPSMIIAIVIVVFTSGSFGTLILVLVLAGWVMPFRVMRSILARAYAQPYIEAARVSGLSGRQIAARHLLPEMLPHLAVVTSIVFAALLIMESSLGFLGIGIKPPTPEWGQMVSEGRAQIARAWWISLPAGAALVTFLVGLQLVADAISDRYSVAGIIRRRR
jgi:peptide/nickel transport system permease protein